MSWKIGMPNLGHTMEEGKVSEWLKAVGDSVHKREVIAVVESDKASFDIEAPADGVLGAVYAEAGAVVAVGGEIGLVLAPGERLQAAPASVAAAVAAPVAATAAPIAAAPAARTSARGRISPAARALAEQLGVDWEQVEGTGDDGMVTRDDVRDHAAQAKAAPAASAAPAAVSLSPMRRAIADATARAWATIPHVPLHGHADVTALVQAGTGGITAAVVRACALALREHPAFNGWLVDNSFLPAAQSDVAVAVSTPEGLVTAVVQGAQSKSVAALQAEIADLAQQARAGRLDGSRMTGGSFTVSSLGRWGVDAFAPIIAAPQVAILGVGSIRRVAREGENGAVRFVSELGLTLVFDHRANDGVQAAQLLASIVACLEQPGRLE